MGARAEGLSTGKRANCGSNHTKGGLETTNNNEIQLYVPFLLTTDT